jgi:uncharacterized protein YihD (DUF1040 family)
MILVLRNDYNVEVFLDVFEAWLKASSLPFTKYTNHETEVYTITHELGSKWSTYLSHMLQTVFAELGFKEVIIEKTDDIVMFKIPLSQVVENLSLSKTRRASSKQLLDR